MAPRDQQLSPGDNRSRVLYRPGRRNALAAHIRLWRHSYDVEVSGEHGVGHTPFGDHAAAVAGLEVVLPSGELPCTGLWALPNDPVGILSPGSHSVGPGSHLADR